MPSPRDPRIAVAVQTRVQARFLPLMKSSLPTQAHVVIRSQITAKKISIGVSRLAHVHQRARFPRGRINNAANN